MTKIILILFLLGLVGTNKLFAQSVDKLQKEADEHYTAKEFQPAIDAYSKAIIQSKDDKDHRAFLYFKRSFCYKFLKQSNKCLADLNQSILLNPNVRAPYWERGVLYDANKDYQLALLDYTKAITFPQDDKSAVILLTNIATDQFNLHNYDLALRSDSLTISINPLYSNAYWIRGDLHMALKQYELANADLTTAIMNYTDDKKRLSYIYFDRANAKAKLEQNKEAINDFSYAIVLDPENKGAYWNRAFAYHNNGDYKLAIDDYAKTITFFNGDNLNLSKLYDNKALNEMNQTLYTKAIADDSLAIVFNPQNKFAYWNMATAYAENGDHDLSINILNKTIDLYKDDKRALAILYSKIADNECFLKETDKVIADCNMAISLNPKYYPSYFSRGKAYLTKNGNAKLAVNDFKKIIAMDSTKKSVDYVFSLYYTGKQKDAIAIIQQDLLDPKNSVRLREDYYNMACLYSLMNKADEANIYLKRAIDSGQSKRYVLIDSDLDNIRQTDEYKSIMNSTLK